jgi:hypothetical protein
VSGPSQAERQLQRSAAAHASWAKTPSRSARLAAAWEAREARFERLVDPDGAMTPADRAKAAESARKAFYAEMARKSAAARRKRKSAEQDSGPAAA